MKTPRYSLACRALALTSWLAPLIVMANGPALTTGEAQAELRHATVAVNGIRIHYVVTGVGEPVILVPGWPECWLAWRRVIPEFVRGGRRVYAIDPRGFGESEKSPTGYDPVTAADDLHGFIEALGLAKSGGVDIVGHDLGTWIAFAHATTYPGDVRRLVLSEANLPGVSALPGGTPDAETNLRIWHFGFFRLDDLPEMLVRGHEREFLTWFFTNKTRRKDAIEPAALDEYVRLFSDPGTARASFNYYRDFFAAKGIAQMQANARRRLRMPVLALGAEGGVGSALLNTVRPLGDNVHGGVLAGFGHYLPEECPELFARTIAEFWAANPSSSTEAHQ